ncbi:MAG TPA: hypothetical protein VFR61_07740 [Nitrososphaeraceae archaeon]|jgi:hypothetical protein|nr:hypothetical protein [Nitrososphaeraceae archaeon]
MNEEEKAFDKVKKGFKEAGEGVKDVVGGTAQGVKEAVDDTAEGAKEGVEDAGGGVKNIAERVTDSDPYTGNEDAGNAGNRQYNESGGKEPMNPEDIASHEPTAVKRDKKQGTSGDPL